MTSEFAVAQEIRQVLADEASLAAIDDGNLADDATEMVLAALEGAESLAKLLDDDIRAERRHPGTSTSY